MIQIPLGNENISTTMSNDNEKESSRFTVLSDPRIKADNNKVDNPNSCQSGIIQPRVPPTHGISDVLSPKKLLFQMDLFSPYKSDRPKSGTPKNKRRFSDSHTGLTPGISQLLPSKAKRSRTSLGSGMEDASNASSPEKLSPLKTIRFSQGDSDTDVEMKPSHVFANSPGSPSFRASQCKEMLDDIDVSPRNSNNGGEEDFLKRPTNYNIRRCKSLEIRKQLIDMTNTPPSVFKKSLFKKPAPIAEVKSPLMKETNQGCLSREHSPLDLKDDFTCESAEHLRIKKAVESLQTDNLIADGSRKYCLPLVKGKYSDLQNIDHETMAMLLTDKYPCKFDKLSIIDCRYPYEYRGGHIRGAVNVYTEEAMVEFLNREVEETTNLSSVHILVFHCEFSSHRGPNLLRHLRNCDRQMNMSKYPQLTFPEIYCLFGGYKDFYSHYPELCEPSGYTPMMDEKYASDLRHFRAKAKSWAAGDRLKSKQQQSL